MVQPLWRTICGNFLKVKHLPYDLTILLLDIYPITVKTYACPYKTIMCAESFQLCLLHDPMGIALWAPLSMGFSRQEYWS